MADENKDVPGEKGPERKEKPTKKEKVAKDEKEGAPKKTLVIAKTAFDWNALLKKARTDAWRKLRITIQVRGKLYAGKPASLDAANAMIGARGLQDLLEALRISDPNALTAAAEKHGLGEIIDTRLPVTAEDLAGKIAEVKDEGLCEFVRREGIKGIWVPSNNMKACWKENWSVLGLRNSVRGSRGALAEGVFINGISTYPTWTPEGGAVSCTHGGSLGDVSLAGCPVCKAPDGERDWFYLGEKPDGIDTMVSHTTGPKGPVSSIKRHEYMLQPRITYEAWIATALAVAEKFSDDDLSKMFEHAGEHGFGACRSQGAGKFDVLKVEPITE